jgi:Na+/melibiose symporter-like transporter
MKGKNEEAVQALRRLRGRTADLKAELNDLIVEEEHRLSQNFGKALKRTSSRKAMMICFGLMIFQQLSGINAVIFYTTTIFRDAKIELKPEFATIIIGVIQVLATFVATMTVDRVGRRVLLVLSDILMAICTLTLGVYYGLKGNEDSATVDGFGLIPLLSLCVFVSAFSLGFGPVAWIMIGEARRLTFTDISLNFFVEFFRRALLIRCQRNRWFDDWHPQLDTRLHRHRHLSNSS